MNPSVSLDARRTVLVTGAATGIGAATARRFLREGWNVVINHLDGQQAEAQALAALASLATDAPNQRALCVAGDVTQDADCVRLVQAAVQACGPLHGLVNAAGVSKMVPHARLHDVSAEDFQRIYAVNTVGTFQMIRAAAPALKASSSEAARSAVVNISSRAALMGSGSSVPYACSKAAVNALTMSMAHSKSSMCSPPKCGSTPSARRWWSRASSSGWRRRCSPSAARIRRRCRR
jgi:3-oxoacyl-[acyl-carrier protein] reductase